MGALDRILGDGEEKRVSEAMKFAAKVLNQEEKTGTYTKHHIKTMTLKFQKELKGKELSDIDEDVLVEIFALVREVAWRVLGIKHFKVQVAGAYLMFNLGVVEMATGEGKTLVSTMPAYARALMGEKVHIVTVNEYLVKRDSEQMGKVFDYLGLGVGAIYNGQDDKEERKKQYEKDVVYGTISEFGFDYLKDNLAKNVKDTVQKSLDFVIMDEIDSILIDEARTPLIISNKANFDTTKFIGIAEFVRGLNIKVLDSIDFKRDKNNYDNVDYVVDRTRKSVFLTEDGIRKAEEHFGVTGLADNENRELMSYINLSIKAFGVLQKDVDYVIKDGFLHIVDENTGRILYGRKYSDGLHQSIEAKENIDISGETRAVAKITLQHLYRVYKHGCGMTGTAYTESGEFYEIYALDVYRVPTNEKMIRKDGEDIVYTSREGKLEAIVDRVEQEHNLGRPVLLGTPSVEKNIEISELLKERGIKHEVLNAVDNHREAEIVASAGRSGSITVATNMAGRGTDIILGGNPKVLTRIQMKRIGYMTGGIDQAEEIYEMQEGLEKTKKLTEINDGLLDMYTQIIEEYKEDCRADAEKVKSVGGLLVIGTERHDSRRVDNQLRGRAGRQGEPGESVFYLSLEDDLLRMFGSEEMIDLIRVMEYPEDQPIELKVLSKLIERAQKKVENLHFSIRKQVMEYDNVTSGQRNKIYEQRRRVLSGEDIRDDVIDMGKDKCIEVVHNCYNDVEEFDEQEFKKALYKYSGLLFSEDIEGKVSESIKKEDLENILIQSFVEIYDATEKIIGSSDMRNMERVILLMKVDKFWVDHIDTMNELSIGMNLRAFGQQNPLSEYVKEGNAMYGVMLSNIREETIANILSLTRSVRRGNNEDEQ